MCGLQEAACQAYIWHCLDNVVFYSTKTILLFFVRLLVSICVGGSLLLTCCRPAAGALPVVLRIAAMGVAEAPASLRLVPVREGATQVTRMAGR